MTTEYSVDTCKALERRFRECRLNRPFQVGRYDPGDRLEYDVTPVDPVGDPGRVALVVEKFVGGGFAGQVYKVRVVESVGATAATLPVGGTFALKILVPPSGGARLFRNLLYAVGFQGPFQPQTNPSAARAGALWQKFIRRAVGIRLGDESGVNNVHGTFVDHTMGSCGEISDWIDGRTWHLEVDDRTDLLKRWNRGKPVDESELGSPEYRAKKAFMAAFVKLLNEMGAHEFARQYEWSTWKSQPNCLKRTATEDDPAAGLTAVDFRAGLALLPFLPMSPGDFMLIVKGLGRGSLVQFDRGDLKKLKAFIGHHTADFADMQDLLVELERMEQIYRDSLIDVTHNHVRLLFSRSLWKQILASAVTGWRVRGMVDDEHERSLRGKGIRIALFGILGLVPILGPVIRKAWGRADYRAHYRSMLTRPGYLKRAFSGKMAERAVTWHRAGRITEGKAARVASSLPSFVPHLAVSLFPVTIHRLLTDGDYLKERLHYIAVRPIRLYFNAEMREQWLRDMVKDGRRKRIVSGEDAETILSRIREPFIQKYLKSLAVHVCTVPVTQVVSVIVAAIYILTHPELPRAQAWGVGFGIVALFQLTPVSPGSLVRGLYVVYLAIRERDFRDYNIAIFLGFFKYIGYLAFPIQMTHHYPTLARFMAAHWATDAVHIVPVFGEGGALLEHKVFTLFYNIPLTIRGRMRRRAALRASSAPRRWHLLFVAVGSGLLLGAAETWIGRHAGHVATLGEIWWCVLVAALLSGASYTLMAGGAGLGSRVLGAVLCGIATAAVFSLVSFALAGGDIPPGDLAVAGVWRAFALAVVSPVGAILTELSLPEP